ncbi:MAG: RsmE family RNA methyltransferase, partial [Dehalococcoidia bacterium]|nr:RsmE family RNA methyltransferase [Dehalococcoidia bacterium]
MRLEGAQAYQISRVLRFRKGDPLILLDNSGWEYLVEISAVSDGCVLARLTERRPAPPEPRLSVTIYQGLLKGKKFDWTLQKGTEIGVAAFVPIACERCVALPAEDRSGQRWGHIIQEAAEQCGRGRLPNLGPPRTFRDACDEAARPSFLLWERPGAASLREMLHKASWEQTGQVGLFVGPEGGFSREEVSYA